MKNLITFILLTLSFSCFSQYDWSQHNYKKENKKKVKASGSALKALKKYPVFITRYEIGQAIHMFGSQKSATKAVHAKVGLSGIDATTYQKMVDELHQEFVEGLKSLHLPYTDGNDILQLKTVEKYKKKDKDYYHIGNIGNNTKQEVKGKLIDGGSIRMYPATGGVSEALSFSPTNKNVYYCDHLLKSGLFYQNLVYKEKVNLITARYYVNFAGFDGGKGYKSINLSTNALLCVGVQFQIQTAKGAPIFITYEKPIFAGNKWSLGLKKTNDNSSNLNEAFGWGSSLARQAKYMIHADAKKYIAELQAAISGIQQDIITSLKNEI